MIRVDQRKLEMAQRIAAMEGESSTRLTAIHFLALGLTFHGAWLTGSEIRNGLKPSPFDMTEYNHVKGVLDFYGWGDLLDA